MLRLATTADADAVGRFQTLAWEQTYRGLVADAYLDGTTWQDRAARWGSRIGSGERTVWLAEVDGALVGVASTAPTRADRPDLPPLELASIYVDASWHGRGIAPALLDRAIGQSPAHLWVFDANARARSFYVKSGFQPSAETQLDTETGLTETRWLRP